MQKARNVLLGYDPTFVDFASNAEAGPDMSPGEVDASAMNSDTIGGAVTDGEVDILDEENSDDTFRDFNFLLRQYVGNYGSRALVMQMDEIMGGGSRRARYDSDSDSDSDSGTDQGLGGFVVVDDDNIAGAIEIDVANIANAIEDDAGAIEDVATAFGDDAGTIEDAASLPDTPVGEPEGLPSLAGYVVGEHADE